MLWIYLTVRLCIYLRYNSSYHFELEGLPVAVIIERFKERISRLYEQGANIKRIGQYVLKWVQWTCAGIHQLHKFNILAAPEIIK
jgi:hypothetical protein